ncbi:MAG: serine/threonine protein kinase [Acidobacteria bacterium]|nr:serine/threonine protein kinase [Acidobacteriota bacterium]
MESLLGTTVHGIRLVDRLGQGGMGDVYLGFDERLQRKVAVKAIRSERRLDSVAKARFLREARVLSQLEHPNICRLYDYLEWEAADFLVLEYVQGKSLRELRGDELTHEQKLRVALQVASALVAAHALSVVHRDLKPENVVVTGDGQAKVLDFGLARPVRAAEVTGEFTVGGAPPTEAREPSRGSGGTVTELGNVVGTPRYMSPEQARGEVVTAASDMYSFGLLVQELFTGRSPVPDAADPAVLLRMTMWGETEPITGLDAPLTELINRLKALSPGERPSAQATAERLEWILELPRRRLRRAARIGLALLLAGAAVVSTAGFLAARRAQRRAESSEATARQAQADAEAVNTFLRSMLTSPDPRSRGIEVKVVDVLDRAAESVERDFAGRFTSQAAILETIGSTYHAVGEMRKAAELLDRAFTLRRGLHGVTAPETLAAEHQLGVVLVETGAFDRAEELLREVLVLRWATLGPDHRQTLETVGALARVLQVVRKLEEAERLLRWGHATRLATLGPDDPATIDGERALGIVLRDTRRFAEAELLLCSAYERSLQQFGPDHQLTYEALASLGALYSRAKRFAESASALGEVLDALRRTRGPDHPLTLKVANTQGRNFAELGRFAEADALLRQTLEVQRRELGSAHLDTLDTMTSLAYSAHLQGRQAESDALIRQRWEIAAPNLGIDDPITLQCKSAYADGLARKGRTGDAETLFREILSVRRRVLGEHHQATQSTRSMLARLLAASGRLDEARSLDPAVTVSSTPSTSRR